MSEAAAPVTLTVDPGALAIFVDEREEQARLARECHEKLVRDYAALVGSVSPIALHCYWTASAHLKACQTFALRPGEKIVVTA